jgi:hypothetical protein
LKNARGSAAKSSDMPTNTGFRAIVPLEMVDRAFNDTYYRYISSYLCPIPRLHPMRLAGPQRRISATLASKEIEEKSMKNKETLIGSRLCLRSGKGNSLTR